jgi:hypothetical protein
MAPFHFLSGFIYNILVLFFHMLPMSIEVGAFCYNEDKFIWDLDEGDILEALNGDEEE